jgi:hypothetical protein
VVGIVGYILFGNQFYDVGVVEVEKKGRGSVQLYLV